MTRKLFILVFGAIISGQASAMCVVDTLPPDGGGLPQTLRLPTLTVTIDADAPSSTAQPIFQQETPMSGVLVSYHECKTGGAYGRNVTPLAGVELPDRMFATNIEGIAIKPWWGNGGGGFGAFNSQGVFSFSLDGQPTETGRANFPSTTTFKVELYKIKDTLNLTNPNGDLVLPSGDLAYYWLNQNSLANAGLTLAIGEIKIISTPSCTFNGTRVVDFGVVTASTLSSGIERELNFNITCKTDYGHYSTTAAISTQTPTTDGNYIKVKDSQDQDDRLHIKISDGSDIQMKVNGSTTEQRSNIASGVPADFKWKATLESASASDKPANGAFTAMAEIILQVN